MKNIFLLALLVAVAAVAMPHEFASKKLFRLAASHQARSRLTLGAPVTFEKFGTSNTTDLMCEGERHYGIQMNVGECKALSSSFAVNITDWVQPPIHGKEPEGICASFIHYADSDCKGEASVITFDTKKCQAGEFWAEFSAAAPEILSIHSACKSSSVTDVTCTNCNATTHVPFNKCTNIPTLHGSVDKVRVEKCSPVRLNLLTSCTEGKVYDSYVLGQDRCFDGYKVRDGHH